MTVSRWNFAVNTRQKRARLWISTKEKYTTPYLGRINSNAKCDNQLQRYEITFVWSTFPKSESDCKCFIRLRDGYKLHSFTIIKINHSHVTVYADQHPWFYTLLRGNIQKQMRQPHAVDPFLDSRCPEVPYWCPNKVTLGIYRKIGDG